MSKGEDLFFEDTEVKMLSTLRQMQRKKELTPMPICGTLFTAQHSTAQHSTAQHSTKSIIISEHP